MLAHFLAGDDFSVTLHQHYEEAIRQVLEFDAVAVSRKRALTGIKLEWAETIKRCAG
jgi:transposase